MTNTQQRFLQLVEELSVDQAIRQELRERIETEGVSNGVIEEVKLILDKAIVEYEATAQEEIRKLQTQLEETVSKFENEFAEIEEQARQAVKDKRRKQDETKLEEVRKKIQG